MSTMGDGESYLGRVMIRPLSKSGEITLFLWPLRCLNNKTGGPTFGIDVNGEEALSFRRSRFSGTLAPRLRQTGYRGIPAAFPRRTNRHRLPTFLGIGSRDRKRRGTPSSSRIPWRGPNNRSRPGKSSDRGCEDPFRDGRGRES